MKKKITIGWMSAVLYLLFAACSGNPGDGPEEGELRLSADKSALVANGSDKVTFTVLKGTADVTGQSEIWMTNASGVRTRLESPSFATKEEGRYGFEAVYGSETSENEVTVVATAPAPAKFYRRVCLMKFTQINCSFCPDGARKLDLLQDFFPGRIVEMAFHSSSLGADPMAIAETETIQRVFPTSYPGVVTDMRSAADGQALYAATKEAVQLSIDSHPALCGIELSSSYDAQSGKLSVDVEVKADAGGNLSLAVYLLESKLVYPDYPQKDGGLTVSDYVHNHVVRKMLSANVMGDDLGAMSPDQESKKSYEASIEGWDADNMDVVAYVIDKSTGYITNVSQCKANGGASEYEYNP